MAGLRKILGTSLEIWGGIRIVVDLLESIEATRSYARIAVLQLVSAPSSRTLTATVIAVGLALMFYEPLRDFVKNLGNDDVQTLSLTNATGEKEEPPTRKSRRFD